MRLSKLMGYLSSNLIFDYRFFHKKPQGKKAAAHNGIFYNKEQQFIIFVILLYSNFFIF